MSTPKHQKYQRLIGRTRALSPPPCVVVHPCDESWLRGAMEAARAGLIKPRLAGPQARVEALAAPFDLDLTGCEVVDARHRPAHRPPHEPPSHHGRAGDRPLAKRLGFMANAGPAGIVPGARMPIIRTRRADSLETRRASGAVAASAAQARREGLKKAVA